MSRGNKLIVILGPTASGKTDLSIKLAKKFNGEIVSADSRQVYKGMDIGTGKITKKEMQGVPHYLLDVANPKTRFTVSQFQKLALKAINKIHKKNKIPFLVGGTGFYIQSVVDDIVIPEVKPDWKLRKKLEKLNTEQLFKKLKKLDPKRTESIDKSNPRRLIRALEIVLKTGKAVPLTSDVAQIGLRRTSPALRVLKIGIKKSNKELKKNIYKRLLKRLENNVLINEVEKLHNPPAGGPGLSWKRLEEFGLEYRFVAQYLQNKIAYKEMIDKIQKESEHFTKRQMTWFKRDKKIYWIKNCKKAEKSIKNFINKK
ncbi:MAG: hypothetical protein CEN87_418 [Parcubacteria group bacterium Licking1014_1]|nr:MAG: hypothetical protein CEN87_418 [Parcubacteria group bacterium Licking1014_1]